MRNSQKAESWENQQTSKSMQKHHTSNQKSLWSLTATVLKRKRPSAPACSAVFVFELLLPSQRLSWAERPAAAPSLKKRGVSAASQLAFTTLCFFACVCFFVFFVVFCWLFVVFCWLFVSFCWLFVSFFPTSRLGLGKAALMSRPAIHFLKKMSKREVMPYKDSVTFSGSKSHGFNYQNGWGFGWGFSESPRIAGEREGTRLAKWGQSKRSRFCFFP